MTLLQRGLVIRGFPLEANCSICACARVKRQLIGPPTRLLQWGAAAQSTSPAIRDLPTHQATVGSALYLPGQPVWLQLDTVQVRQGEQPDTWRFITPLRASMDHSWTSLDFHVDITWNKQVSPGHVQTLCIQGTVRPRMHMAIPVGCSWGEPQVIELTCNDLLLTVRGNISGAKSLATRDGSI